MQEMIGKSMVLRGWRVLRKMCDKIHFLVN